MNDEAWKLWKGCKRKKGYSKSGAIYKAQQVRKKSRENVREYKCLFCEWWHIGHPHSNYSAVLRPDSGELIRTDRMGLPPPDPEHVICALYDNACDYCWHDIPHALYLHQSTIEAQKEAR